MESNLSYFSLPFIDNADVDFTLPSHGSLFGADDVLAQFLSGDELLEEPDLNGPTTLHCEICTKQFDNAKKYYGHLRVHSKDNLWICDKCPKEKFSTKQQLMKHRVAHKPLERVWRCPQCDMSFEALWKLQQHLYATHFNYRPHKCDKCEMSFHKLSDLKKHKDIHEDVKKHSCKVCMMRFNDVSNLKRHMLTHGNEKPYPCVGCGNRFTQLASMKRHSKNCVMVKQKDSPVDKTMRQNYCRVCGKTFQYKSALLEHCVREHSNSPPPQNEPKDKTEEKYELHVDTRTINTNTTQINIDTPHTSHIDTSRSSIETTLNIDSNQTVNIDINHHINLNPNPPLNILTNHVNMNSNPAINIQTNNINVDRNQTVDNIVDDILSAEDDYLIRHPMSNQMLYNPEENHDNLISQIELLKEMNHMHILDDELLCNDLDFDSFQTMCNTNDMDYSDRNELLFDIPDARSMDQDIMNALYQVKGDIPDLLNEPEAQISTEKVNDFLINPPVSVNECATIFESDIDLEASTNLAANLNQLIGENNVQYISTEHDDTFIIRLNSDIDAEQLTDLLNIGVGSVEETNKTFQEANKDKQGTVTEQETNREQESKEPTAQPITITIDNLPENITKSSNQSITQPISVIIQPVIENENKTPDVLEKAPKTVKTKKRVYYVCRKCDKIFNKKENYKSHRATHEPSLRHHTCPVCGEQFSYKSTLNKHVKRRHMPFVAAAHCCKQCDKSYQAAWMLKRHVARDHDCMLQFKCGEKECGKSFYSQPDLDIHQRFHKGERPHTCNVCSRSFHLMSHLKRHIRLLHDSSQTIEMKTVSPKQTALQSSNSLLLVN